MTWEELNKKYNYDFNRLILCMPNDVQKDITKAWGGGALNPYNAADYVLVERKLFGIEVDLDVVAKKYEKKFLRKPHDRRPKNKSFNDSMGDKMSRIESRAEMLAAMDCIMSHLVDEDDRTQWFAVAITNEGQDRHLLDTHVEKAERRKEFYYGVAGSMSCSEFECVVRTFADIVSGQCFVTEYQRGVFK